MSKSQNNSQYIDIYKLYDIAKLTNSDKILINEDIILNITNEEYKKYCNNL